MAKEGQWAPETQYASEAFVYVADLKHLRHADRRTATKLLEGKCDPTTASLLIDAFYDPAPSPTNPFATYAAKLSARLTPIYGAAAPESKDKLYPMAGEHDRKEKFVILPSPRKKKGPVAEDIVLKWIGLEYSEEGHHDVIIAHALKQEKASQDQVKAIQIASDAFAPTAKEEYAGDNRHLLKSKIFTQTYSGANN